MKRTEDGGRTQPIPLVAYGLPVFFNDIPALAAHGYDCRMLVTEYGAPISPGDTVDEIALLFLYEDDVLPYIQPGVTFSLWEGKTIGSGSVLRVDA